ncbi:MAG: lipopolysaccharide biosynthesis protein, partial [Flavobacteriales bacterium]
AYGLQLPLLFQVDVKDASTALLVIAITLALPSAWMHVRLVKELPAVGDAGQLFRAHWSNGRALVLTAVLQWSSGNLFLLAAGGMLGASAMGALRMAQNLLGVLNVLFLALENSVPLNAARVLQEQGTRALAGYMGSALKRAAIPTVAVIAVLILFPGPLMGLVYGPEQYEHAWLLSAFAGSYLFVFLGTFLRFALRTLDRNRAILLGYIVTSVFSLVTAKALVGHLGLPGVMIGLFSVQLINLLIYARSVRELWPWNK